jgi:hypothetical protein
MDQDYMHYWVIADNIGKPIAKSVDSYFYFEDAQKDAMSALMATRAP